MPLVDWEIKLLAKDGLIQPFFADRLSSMGYDLTLSHTFKLPVLDADEQIVDPFCPPVFQDKVKEDYIVIPPHSFVLGATVERVSLPSNLMGICLGRSTYARAGIITHITPIEPGFEGVITIEISNTNPLPVKVHVNEGITQVVFFKADYGPEKDYLGKGGRYQGQVGVTQGRPQ